MSLSPIAKGDVETFDKVIATNLRGTFVVFTQAAQHVAEGGRIIAFSSSVLARDSPPTASTSPPKQVSKGSSLSSQMNFADTRSPSMPLPQDPLPPRFSSRARAKN
jgi:NAD(P)-dependent dehydrogenase (short-subunit alcohol dehydrogenase family)